MTDEPLDPPGTKEYCYAVVRRNGRSEFYDVNSIGMTAGSAMRKSYMVEELKPEWVKKYPYVRVAKVRFVEIPDPTLARE